MRERESEKYEMTRWEKVLKFINIFISSANFCFLLIVNIIF